jgi:hypothetical protein
MTLIQRNNISEYSSYFRRNTLRRHYEDQSVNVVYVKNRYLFWEAYETYKFSP